MVSSTDTAPEHAVAVPHVCGCGQDLDCCERAHCPRCGREIRGAA